MTPHDQTIPGATRPRFSGPRFTQPRFPQPRFPQPRFPQPRIDIFAAVNTAAKGQIETLCRAWLGHCQRSGDNLAALNPTRPDKHVGSFSINIRTGAWADFATGDRGSDIISFYAYIRGMTQIDAARALAAELGVRS